MSCPTQFVWIVAEAILGAPKHHHRVDPRRRHAGIQASATTVSA